jgi:hypothetical protein
VVFVKHDPTATTVAAEMAQIAAAEPQVLVVMTAGTACLGAVNEAAATGLKEAVLVRFIASGCKVPGYMVPAGEAAGGLYAVGAGLRSLNDPAFAEDTFVKFAREQLTASGLDPKRELVGVGFAQYGWAHVEILRTASGLPGGLTRSNVLLALRGTNLDHPMLLDGVRFATAGDYDAYFVEGAEYTRYDARTKAWFVQGPAADLNGLSPNCVWSKSRCGR